MKWTWGAVEEKSFDAVKKLIHSSRVLTHFNPQLPLIVACDASPIGLGAVLSHRFPDGSDRPVAFVSRTLTTTERKYAQIDKEGLAVIFAVKKFHNFIFGRKFEIWTDHKPLLGLLGENCAIPQTASARIQRWAMLLAGYSYTLHHKRGQDNGNADVLSRLPLNTTRM